jgi:TonB family protein
MERAGPYRRGPREGARRPPLLAAGMIAAALLGASAGAQPAGPRKAGWAIDYGAQRCALIRTAEGEDPLTLAIRMIPGRGSPEIILAKRNWDGTGLIGASSVILRFSPSGRELRADAVWLPNQAGVGDLLQLGGIPSDFIDLFAATVRIDVVRKRGTVLVFPIPGAARAAQALRDCNSDLLRAWGVDEAALSALQRPATPIGSELDWFSGSDYPNSAYDRRSRGIVVVRLNVDASGRLADCAVVATSDSSALDAQTCVSIRKRARFEPALGPEGKPVSTAFIRTVAWVIPY